MVFGKRSCGESARPPKLRTDEYFGNAASRWRCSGGHRSVEQSRVSPLSDVVAQKQHDKKLSSSNFEGVQTHPLSRTLLSFLAGVEALPI